MVMLHFDPIVQALAFFQLSGRFLKSLRKRFQDKLAMANNTAEETISNMRTVRAFTNEEKMKGLYNKDINSSYFLGRKIAFLQGEVVVWKMGVHRL